MIIKCESKYFRNVSLETIFTNSQYVTTIYDGLFFVTTYELTETTGAYKDVYKHSTKNKCHMANFVNSFCLD